MHVHTLDNGQFALSLTVDEHLACAAALRDAIETGRFTMAEDAAYRLQYEVMLAECAGRRDGVGWLPRGDLGMWETNGFPAGIEVLVDRLGSSWRVDDEQLEFLRWCIARSPSQADLRYA
jgi:hypothetical protein